MLWVRISGWIPGQSACISSYSCKLCNQWLGLVSLVVNDTDMFDHERKCQTERQQFKFVPVEQQVRTSGLENMSGCHHENSWCLFQDRDKAHTQSKLSPSQLGNWFFLACRPSSWEAHTFDECKTKKLWLKFTTSNSSRRTPMVLGSWAVRKDGQPFGCDLFLKISHTPCTYLYAVLTTNWVITYSSGRWLFYWPVPNLATEKVEDEEEAMKVAVWNIPQAVHIDHFCSSTCSVAILKKRKKSSFKYKRST